MDILTGAEMAKAAIDGALSTAEKGAGLIGKWNQGLGVLFSPGGKKHDEEEAVRYYIEEIKKDPNMPSLVKAQKIAQARKDLRGYINQAEVIEKAIAQMSESEDHSEDVEEDWFQFFFDKVRLISDTHVQDVWAMLLCAECKKPKSISRSLVHILSVLNSVQANDFTNLLKFTMRDCQYEGISHPIIFYWHNGLLYKEFGISYQMLYELEQLGLIHCKMDGPKDQFYFADPNKTFGYGQKIMTVYAPSNGRWIPAGNVKFTSDGQSLAHILQPRELDFSVFDITLSRFQHRNCHVVVSEE